MEVGRSRSDMGKVSELWLTCGGILLMLCVPSVFGWGAQGHFAICKMAQGFLTEDALTEVQALLPEYADGELAAVCSWPDEFRKLMPWSTALHFVDQPDSSCNYEYCRDCHDTDGNKDRCVTGAIYNYTDQLQLGFHKLSSEMNYNLTEALMFVSHFFGDVHQPLHAGFLGDSGGNTIIVSWYQNETNLHKVWDDKIIETSLQTFHNSDLSSLIQAIQSKISGVWFTESLSWRNCTSDSLACPDPYASESSELACKFAYKDVTQGAALGDEYFLSCLPVVEKRLAQAGVRLAATLNRIFSSQLYQSHKIECPTPSTYLYDSI
ncbi:endonuclease 3 [Daucus carota subsp. sativus]|nr:PREDICTED: endonuclease 3-like [Daucus carota subsp. sativus]